MFLEENRAIETILRAVLRSHTSELRLRLVEDFRKEGCPALSVGMDPRPDAPSVVVFDEPNHAAIYLFTGPRMNEAEFEVFRKEAQAFAWDHHAAAYFVRIDDGVLIRGTD